MEKAKPEEEREEGDEGDEGDEDEDDDDDSEVGVVLDEDGRVPGGLPDAPKPPDLDFGFRSFPSFLDMQHSSTPTLLTDCTKAFTARSSKKGEQYSAGQTYYIKSNEQPRCPLEELALRVFRLHTDHLTAGEDFDPSTSGAEWWTLVLDTEDDVALHWDRDYAIEADGDVHVHPHLATVTYLSSIGSPTCVFDWVGCMQGPDISPETRHDFADGFLSRPFAGKHISFDGRLLHGAPSDADVWGKGGGGDRRITFLVNIWLNYVPYSTERLDEAVARSMETKELPVRDGAAEEGIFSFDLGGLTEEVKHVKMNFRAGGKGTLTFPVPAKEMKACEKESASFHLAFATEEGAANRCLLQVTNKREGDGKGEGAGAKKAKAS